MIWYDLLCWCIASFLHQLHPSRARLNMWQRRACFFDMRRGSDLQVESEKAPSQHDAADELRICEYTAARSTTRVRRKLSDVSPHRMPACMNAGNMQRETD